MTRARDLANLISTGLRTKKVQTLTSSQTWTVPTGVKYIDVTCIGAAAAIGGAGAVVSGTIDTSALQGTGISITVGAAPNPNTNGSGGSSSFGSYITAGGGFAGDASNWPGLSGTTYVSDKTIPATATLIPFITTYGSGVRDIYQSGISYNSSAGLYITTGSGTSTTAAFPYYTSPNGTTWTRRTFSNLGSSYNYGNMGTYNGRTFVSVYLPSSTGYLSSTSDGINWTTATNIAFSRQLIAMSYSSTTQKYYFIVNDNTNSIMGTITSVTSANITNVTTPVSEAGGFSSSSSTTSLFITNGSNVGIAFQPDYTGNVLKFSRFNGSTWSSWANHTGTFSMSLIPSSAAWDGSKFTIVATGGAIYTSTDMSTFTNTSVTIPSLYIAGYSSGYYYGSINNLFSYSTNGTTWTTVAVPYSNNPVAVNGTNFIFIDKVGETGLMHSFNISTPNTTIAPGNIGLNNNGTMFHGSAGGYPQTSAANVINDGPGIDGYGIAAKYALLPSSYGSTNGSVGMPGAVILEWLE